MLRTLARDELSFVAGNLFPNGVEESLCKVYHTEYSVRHCGRRASVASDLCTPHSWSVNGNFFPRREQFEQICSYYTYLLNIETAGPAHIAALLKICIPLNCRLVVNARTMDVCLLVWPVNSTVEVQHLSERAKQTRTVLGKWILEIWLTRLCTRLTFSGVRVWNWNSKDDKAKGREHLSLPLWKLVHFLTLSSLMEYKVFPPPPPLPLLNVNICLKAECHNANYFSEERVACWSPNSFNKYPI